MRISTSKSKPRAEDVLAQQAALAGLGQGDFQPLDGQRILGPDVDVSALGADGVSGDGHAFDHAVRIAFQHAAVHERAGIAFVGVADDELLVACGLAGELPLSPGGEARAAAAAQAGNVHRFDQRLGVVLRDGLGEGLVAVAGDVVVDLLRVDHAAVAQEDFLLPLEEVHVGRVGHGAAVGTLMREPLDDLARGRRARRRCPWRLAA